MAAAAATCIAQQSAVRHHLLQLSRCTPASPRSQSGKPATQCTKGSSVVAVPTGASKLFSDALQVRCRSTLTHCCSPLGPQPEQSGPCRARRHQPSPSPRVCNNRPSSARHCTPGLSRAPHLATVPVDTVNSSQTDDIQCVRISCSRQRETCVERPGVCSRPMWLRASVSLKREPKSFRLRNTECQPLVRNDTVFICQ